MVFWKKFIKFSFHEKKIPEKGEFLTKYIFFKIISPNEIIHHQKKENDWLSTMSGEGVPIILSCQ